MMRSWNLLLCAFCAGMTCLFVCVGDDSEGRYGKMKLDENLVCNPSFEQDADGDGFPDGWELPRELCAWDEVEKWDGKRSLQLTNTDPKVYRLITQVVPCKPKRTYYFAVWVKGKGIGGSDRWDQGAGICLEWLDAQGGWLGGSYPQCPEGTFDWQKVEGTATIPENAARVIVVLYLRRANTGTAWFDDVEVREILPTPLRVFLPTHYRRFWRIGVPLSADVEVVRRDEEKCIAYRLRSRLEDAQGEVVWSKEFDFTPQVSARRISLPATLLKRSGTYQWGFSLLLPTGEEVDTVAYPLRLTERMPKVHVDEKLRLIVDGKPFFPLGLYLGPTEDEHLARIADAGFNTILCYGYGVDKDPEGYMNRAAKHGLRVIYSIKDFYEGTQYFPKLGKSGLDLAREYVLKLRNHPALLAWYINDELPPSFVPRLQAMFDLVSELDPNHPTFQVLYQIGELANYFDCTDIIGVDPYPIPRHPLTMVADWTKSAREEMRDRKPVWVVPQLFAWGIYTGKPEEREPTLGEKRCMAYLALIHGCSGLIFYSYFDLLRDVGGKMAQPEVFQRRWGEVRQMVKELTSLLPALLEGETISVKIEPSDTAVHLRCLLRNEEVYVLVANPSDEGAMIALSMPLKGNIKLSSEALRANWDGKKLSLWVAPKDGGFLWVKKGAK